MPEISKEPASSSPDNVIFLNPLTSLFASTVTALLAVTEPIVKLSILSNSVSLIFALPITKDVPVIVPPVIDDVPTLIFPNPDVIVPEFKAPDWTRFGILVISWSKYAVKSVTATCFIVPLSLTTTLSASAIVVDIADVPPSITFNSVAVAVTVVPLIDKPSVSIEPLTSTLPSMSTLLLTIKSLLTVKLLAKVAFWPDAVKNKAPKCPAFNWKSVPLFVSLPYSTPSALRIVWFVPLSNVILPSELNKTPPEALTANVPEVIPNPFVPAEIWWADASNTPSISLIAPTKCDAEVSNVTEPDVWISS